MQRMMEQAAEKAAERKIAAQSTRAEKPKDIAIRSDVDTPRHRMKENSNDFALVVGIEDYSGELPDAQFAERDARAIKSHLLALGVPERNIKLMVGGQATRGRLEGVLEDWLPRMAKAEGRVFFYFSGAGGRSVLGEGLRPLVNKVDTSIGPGSKVVLFAAASPQEVTGSLKDQGHGMFTYYFLKGLGGAAKDASGAVARS